MIGSFYVQLDGDTRDEALRGGEYLSIQDIMTAAYEQLPDGTIFQILDALQSFACVYTGVVSGINYLVA